MSEQVEQIEGNEIQYEFNPNAPSADFAVQHIGKSTTEIKELWVEHLAAQKPAEPTPEPTPAVTPVEPTPEPVQTPEPTPPAVVDWSEFGVQNAEELKAKLGKLSEYEPIVNKYNEVAPQLSVLEQVKNPFANDTIAQLNNFVSKTGITNLQLANDIIGSSVEELSKDPLKAVAIKEILDNPSLSSLSMSQLREYVASKNGVDLSEYGSEDYKLPITLQVDGTKAIQQIEEKKKEFANINNYFVDLQKNTEEQQRQFNTRVEKWNVATPQIVSSIKAIEMKVPSPIEGIEDLSVTVAVSPEEVQKSFEAVKGYFSSSVEPTAEGFKQAQDVLLANLRLAKMQEVIKQTVLAAEGKIREKVIKETHNLAPVTPDRGTPPAEEKFESPNVTALKQKFGL